MRNSKHEFRISKQIKFRISDLAVRYFRLGGLRQRPPPTKADCSSLNRSCTSMLIYEKHAETRSLAWLKSLCKELGWKFQPSEWWSCRSGLASKPGFLIEFHNRSTQRRVDFIFHPESESRFVKFDCAAVGENEPEYWFRENRAWVLHE